VALASACDNFCPVGGTRPTGGGFWSWPLSSRSFRWPHPRPIPTP